MLKSKDLTQRRKERRGKNSFVGATFRSR